MNTKDRILIEALSLFSVQGFSGVSVRDISKSIGLRESAMYKHYKNKQDLFDTIIEVASNRINELQNDLISRFSEEEEDANNFPVEKIQDIYCELFSFYLTDDILSKFRRMMIIEQFKNIELNNKFNEMFIEKTLAYQSEIFRELINDGKINGSNPDMMAIHLLLALLFGVFERIRFVGVWGVQIVTTEGGLAGIKLAVFSVLSSIVTVIIGYILTFSSSIYKMKNKNILIALYYITLCFMILDTLYISILSLFIGGGGDLNGIVTGFGTSDIPFRIVFGIISIINIILFKNRVAPKYKEIFKEEN